MICSIRTGKSGSEWLDRLRSSKGIPTGDDLDLDSFLRTVHSHSPPARPTKPPRTRTSETETHDPPLRMILAQLFTGTTISLTSKKFPRKQTNPKIFIAPSSATGADSPAASPSGDAAVSEEQPAAVDRGCEEENGDGDDADELKGFTRSEVTVIDTSCPGWKVDKLVFRKNNVWKVRERKPKSKSSAKKKKRKSTHEHDDINGTGTFKDDAANMQGEKRVKTAKVI